MDDIWSEVIVAQWCLTLCNPMDNTVHGILHARILEWVAYPFSSGSSKPRNWTEISSIGGGYFTNWALRESLRMTFRPSLFNSVHNSMRYYVIITDQFSSVQSLSRVRLFATPWIVACQASLSLTNSRSSLRLMSIESVMPSSHLILCRPLLLLPPISPSIRVFSNESTLCMRWPKYWSFSSGE